ncbi:MAG TPA: xylulokinase [Anaerolineaceae bacterium]|nr:xylulokinase [Anaerolineaceae bacterium]
MKRLFLGLDVSTTGSKALLVDEQGGVVASGSQEHPISTPRPLWSEQNPHDWWESSQAAIRQALDAAGVSGEAIHAVGLTGQMHGLVLLDAAGQVLRPAILWNDQRTAEECQEMTERIGFDRLLAITGNKALTGFTAPKILWVKKNEPGVYACAAHILLPKDYVRYRLTGDYAMDKADGSGTILFDLKRRDWSPEVLDALEIPSGWLPPTFEGPEITGRITAQVAGQTGLKAGTPVVGGGGDQAAQAVGVGAVSPGIIALTLGTSGVVFAATPQPFIEPEGRLHAFCHSVPATWHLMGVMLSAAGSLRWYRDTFSPGMGYDALLTPAESIPAGCEGLLFLPYLTGERTPYPDPLARGAFVGLTVRHAMPHLTRAVLEGVAFGLRDSMELIRGAGLGEIRQVRVSGGGARSPLWRQILADVMNTEMVTVNTTEGAAYGAALLAGVGAGAWETIPQACEATIHTVECTQPEGNAAGVYERLYAEYRALYPALKPSFDALAAF